MTFERQPYMPGSSSPEYHWASVDVLFDPRKFVMLHNVLQWLAI
jgi:hypothetical protein